MNIQLELNTVRRQWLDEAVAAFQNGKAGLADTFTSDEVHSHLPKPAHRNWYGVLLSQLKNKGLVREVGRVTSKRKEANGRKVGVWEVSV